MLNFGRILVDKQACPGLKPREFEMNGNAMHDTLLIHLSLRPDNYFVEARAHSARLPRNMKCLFKALSHQSPVAFGDDHDSPHQKRSLLSSGVELPRAPGD
jgi:hypothetical protein